MDFRTHNPVENVWGAQVEVTGPPALTGRSPQSIKRVKCWRACTYLGPWSNHMIG